MAVYDPKCLWQVADYKVHVNGCFSELQSYVSGKSSPLCTKCRLTGSLLIGGCLVSCRYALIMMLVMTNASQDCTTVQPFRCEKNSHMLAWSLKAK